MAPRTLDKVREGKEREESQDEYVNDLFGKRGKVVIARSNGRQNQIRKFRMR